MPDTAPETLSEPRTLGWRIRRLRDRAGLTQSDLAAKTGMTRANVSNIEGGRQEPRITALVIMSELLGVTVGVLAGAEPMPGLPPEVRIHTTHAVTCEECGDLGVFRDHSKASQERQRHMRENHIALTHFDLKAES